MKIKDIVIGQALFYVGNYPGMRSMHGMSGIVRSIDESNNQIALEMSLNGTNPSFPVHLMADDVSKEKPASREELRAEVQTLTSEKIDLQNKILVLEGQAQERSRQLDLTKDVADKYNSDISRMGDKLKQAERQILRHEESLKTIRASNEVLRGTNETLMEKNANLERGLTAANAALEAAQKSNDHSDSMIVSLRSQIESLQSIQESMKMMQEGHAPAMKKLQGELHKALHQRDQHKQNSAYWRGIAEKLGYNPGITADKLDPSPGARLDRIEEFLKRQFESFN